MRVAAVQFAPVFKDIGANIALMEELTSQAAKGGAELVVLPEMCTAGYSFLSTSEAKPFCEGPLSNSSPSIKAMQEASNSLGVAIAWGLIEKGDEHGEILYNSQCLVVPGRSDAYFYRKRNLWANDHIWATPGDLSPLVVTWRGKKIGMLICRDIRNKDESLSEFYEPGDADIVAFSSNFGDGGFPSGSWVKFAKATKTHLVVSNRYGQEHNNNFGEGGVCIIGPDGKIHCDGVLWSQPCIVDTIV